MNPTPDELKTSMTDHIHHIETGINNITHTLNEDRVDMKNLKDYIASKSTQLRNETQDLMLSLREMTTKLRHKFNNSLETELRNLDGLKNEIQKISGENLKSQQLSLKLQNRLNHAESELGFKELLKKR